MRAKRAAVGQRTDDDITDEATGQRRVELAAASAARRKAEAAKLAQQNAEMRAKRAAARQSQRTDDDIADEESGRLRTALAEEVSIQDRAHSHDSHAQRIRSRTRPTPILTGVCGTPPQPRQARRRRQEDTRALARQNAAFRRRLKGMRSRTDHRIGDPDVDAMEKLPPEHVREKVQLEEAEELAKLREMLARSTQGRPRSAPGGWDSSPHKPVPYTLRGLKPMYTSAAEPWSRHSAEEWNKLAQGPATRFATSGLKKLDDGQTDSIAQMYHRRRQEEEVAGKRTGRRPWDSTTWMYVPPALRGLKPVTNEPWARDAEANIGLEEFEALAIKQEL